VSLYLRASVGAGRYLFEAARIVEVRPVADPTEAAQWQGEALPRVDLRSLFGAAATTLGCCVLMRQADDLTVALCVDAVDGLVEIGQSEWRPLAPIGPLGQLIDAVATTPGQGYPMLRVRGERVLAEAFGRDIAAGADRG
jgi:chemotaxis signal transduction protein